MDLKGLHDTPPWEWPRETADELLRVLEDEHSSEGDLLLAAEAAGDAVVVNDALIGALIALVRDGRRSEDLRCRAAIALGPALELGFEGEFDVPDEVPFSERLFHEALHALQQVHDDARVPTQVRRHVLEASVRAPQDWHPAAVRAAWAADDPGWKLTAVFCMRYVDGFPREILQALEASDPDVRYQAVLAAGDQQVAGAWSHVVPLVDPARKVDLSLRLAAIDAVASIRPDDAEEYLGPLLHSKDGDIVNAVHEALAQARGLAGLDDDEDDDEDDEDDERSPFTN